MADLCYIGHVMTLPAAVTGDVVDHVIPASLFHSVQVNLIQGVTTGAFSVSVLGSLDNVNFVAIGSAITSSGAINSFQGVYRYLKFHVTTLASGDSVNILYAGT